MAKWTKVAWMSVLGLGVGAPAVLAQELRVRQDRFDMTDYVRPIEAADEVWMDRMTSLEVRDAVRAGKTNVLVPTGSLEENGPYLTTAKHNNVLRVSAESVARRMGDMLVAPIVPLEAGNPERNRMPGSLSLSPETYKAVLRDIGNSLRAQGFKNVFFVGDSGGNTTPSAEAAADLEAAWRGTGVHAYYIPEFYNYDEIMVYQRDELGVDEMRYADGYHDNYYITTMIMVGDPSAVRLEERIKAGKATINGFSLLPIEKSLWHGRQLIEFRTDATVAGIRKAMGQATDQR